MPRLAVGAAIPEVLGVTIDGDSWELSSHRGRRVVLIFHRHAL